MRLFNVLRKLATEGQSVILTLHQPGTRIFQQLDKLLVLSEGHSLYYGGVTFTALLHCPAFAASIWMDQIIAA